MSAIIEYTGLLAITGTIIWWFLAHVKFMVVLRNSHPETYAEQAHFGWGYTNGWKLIDFALSKSYKELRSSRVDRAGDRLVFMYDKGPYLCLALVLLLIGSVLLRMSGWR